MDTGKPILVAQKVRLPACGENDKDLLENMGRNTENSILGRIRTQLLTSAPSVVLTVLSLIDLRRRIQEGYSKNFGCGTVVMQTGENNICKWDFVCHKFFIVLSTRRIAKSFISIDW